MEKVFNFIEKITKNQRNNKIFIVIFAVFAIISMISSVILLIILPKYATIALSVALLNLSLSLCWAVVDKMHYYRDALNESEKYIEKLENENKDYKMNTDVLLNDPEIKRIMQGRIARMPKE